MLSAESCDRFLLAEALDRALITEIASLALVVDAKDGNARHFHECGSSLAFPEKPM